MRAAVLAVALLAVAAVPVGAEPPAGGLDCGFVAITEPAPDTEERGTAVVYGGPVVIAGSGRLVCSLQAYGTSHADPDLVTVASATSAGVVALAPTSAPYVTEPWAPLVMCTSVELDGGAAYYLDAESGGWSTDPAVPCVVPTDPSPPGDVFVDHVDPLLCPVLGGDVYLAEETGWNCPPYDA